jgi:hypothetical protein
MEAGKGGGENTQRDILSIYRPIKALVLGVVTHLTNTAKLQRSTRFMLDSFSLSFILDSICFS